MYSTDQNTASNESKIVVAMNAHYAISYDKHKNRVYLTINGFWKNTETVPHYLTDLRKAVRLTQPGFSLLTDLQTMLTHPQRLSPMHIEAQTIIQDAGLAKAARVLPKDRIATLQAMELAGKSPLASENFTSIGEAERYLG